MIPVESPQKRFNVGTVKPIAHEYANQEEWHRLRSLGLGGSDAAAAIGLNKYKTPYRLWAEKIGILQPDDLSKNEAVEYGNLMEPIGAELYQRRTGKKLHSVHRVLQHPEHSFALVNLDRRVVGEDKLVEIKSAGIVAPVNLDDYGDPGTDKVPLHYRIQCLHSMLVTGFVESDLAVVFGGRPFAYYTIPRVEADIENLIVLERAFWDRVLTGRDIWRQMQDATAEGNADLLSHLEMQLRMVAPPAINSDDALLKFPKPNAGAFVMATPEILAQVELLKDVKAAKSELSKQVRDLDKREDELEGRIADFMGVDEFLRDSETNTNVVSYSLNYRSGYTVEPSEKRKIKIEKPLSANKKKALKA